MIKEIHFEGMLLNISGKDMWTRLTGEFNAYNILAVYATAEILEHDRISILKGISGLNPVNGRFEMIHSKRGITAIVDYAHTPDALKNILDAITKIKNKDQRIITVVGAGGNRDKSKRPEMAKIAVNSSDKAILTSDNPRNENPEDIIQDMSKGIEDEARTTTIHLTDRKEAIKTACLLAGVNDIILVAGKGHEKYQEIDGVRYPFDDVEVLKEILKD
jgi:UDP-N-acetylmuramoyl-L-alanyl-D-glutamate--2,6-diaminopimelate ligase